MEHKTQNITIKKADVDKEMIPLINWLNSFKGVYTRHCCQGNYKNNLPTNKNTAYVVFYCESPVELFIICDHFNGLAEINVESYNGSLRYILRFPTKYSLDATLNSIKEKLWKI